MSTGQGEYTLQTCASKPGQRVKQISGGIDGTVMLKDIDDGRCLVALSGSVLGLGSCGPANRWRVMRGPDGSCQIEHVTSNTCIDSANAGPGGRPILYSCHPRSGVGQTQKFDHVTNQSWIRTPGSWGDNGRQRMFPLCLDRLPVASRSITIQDCGETTKLGVRWERIHEFVPLETKLWNDAEKPLASDGVLGGDMAPP
ncbi:unnamed protein product [Polarella glacialis]|uniref:Ricin B lectin domain-containing protein n=2 Tax=Polarella glacialis TaxID=89957 RepID=A0A813DLH5_POLGL|nr:unnamed protein product [Polarella glacialis]